MKQWAKQSTVTVTRSLQVNAVTWPAGCICRHHLSLWTAGHLQVLLMERGGHRRVATKPAPTRETASCVGRAGTAGNGEGKVCPPHIHTTKSTFLDYLNSCSVSGIGGIWIRFLILDTSLNHSTFKEDRNVSQAWLTFLSLLFSAF